jgi:hypothetical protein
MPVRPIDAQINDQVPRERVPINWKDLIDKDAPQYQRVGACADRKSRATFLGYALRHFRRGNRVKQSCGGLRGIRRPVVRLFMAKIVGLAKITVPKHSSPHNLTKLLVVSTFDERRCVRMG